MDLVPHIFRLISTTGTFRSASSDGIDFGTVQEKAMNETLKTGDKLNHEGKVWTITQVSEDNEGQVVFHLRCEDELSVVKESDLSKELNISLKHASSTKGK